MRTLPLLLLFFPLLACPGTPARPSLPDGQENDVCGIAEEQTRKCAFPLECRRMPIAAVDPKDAERGMSGENGGCGGIAGRQCAKGLSCEMAKEDVMVADAMGTCRQEWRCGPKR